MNMDVPSGFPHRVNSQNYKQKSYYFKNAFSHNANVNFCGQFRLCCNIYWYVLL